MQRGGKKNPYVLEIKREEGDDDMCDSETVRRRYGKGREGKEEINE